jgi:hypothetical protein
VSGGSGSSSGKYNETLIMNGKKPTLRKSEDWVCFVKRSVLALPMAGIVVFCHNEI